MTKLDFYWKSKKEWHHRDEISLVCVVNDDAPEEVKRSYANYLKQVEEASKKGTL